MLMHDRMNLSYSDGFVLGRLELVTTPNAITIKQPYPIYQDFDHSGVTPPTWLNPVVGTSYYIDDLVFTSHVVAIQK